MALVWASWPWRSAAKQSYLAKYRIVLYSSGAQRLFDHEGMEGEKQDYTWWSKSRSVPDDYSTKNTQKYFKHFQSLTMIT
jgi:hypothetical protein